MTLAMDLLVLVLVTTGAGLATAGCFGIVETIWERHYGKPLA